MEDANDPVAMDLDEDELQNDEVRRPCFLAWLVFLSSFSRHEPAGGFCGTSDAGLGAGVV